jgi:hypothetical protein
MHFKSKNLGDGLEKPKRLGACKITVVPFFNFGIAPMSPAGEQEPQILYQAQMYVNKEFQL